VTVSGTSFVVAIPLTVRILMPWNIVEFSGLKFDSAFRNPCLREAASAKAGEIRNIDRNLVY
jgi:hypothetical protein